MFQRISIAGALALGLAACSGDANVGIDDALATISRDS